jgi:diaminopimelate decarboxylase/GNAT superfamily N-acetyltransferase
MMHTTHPADLRHVSPELRAALAAASEDQIVLDLGGIEERYRSLGRELPGVAVRFAMKACPVDEVIACLAERGAGCDAAGPDEIAQAVAAGVPARRIHYGNTGKSDRNIAEALRLGVRDFATDSVEDVLAIARHAPGSRVFCRLATTGDGALWGLSRKFGCSAAEAVLVLDTARQVGLVPAGLSVHVGSQQMSAQAWRDAFEDLAGVIEDLGRRAIEIDHVNLGGGLPALGYVDRRGRTLNPPMDKIFATIREGMEQLRTAARRPLDFLIEPGRYLVADQGAIRAHVARLSARELIDGERQHWLYLSCGKFNGLYEMDKLQYRLVFPEHAAQPYVPAVIAGPTCDGDDVYGHEYNLVSVPREAKSGDPVWILACGAYSISYTTRGFNGFKPLPYTFVRGPRIRHIHEGDWHGITALEAETYSAAGLSEGGDVLRSRARVSPQTCFVAQIDDEVAGYVIALPYPLLQFPDLSEPEQGARDADNLHLHDMVVAAQHRGRGVARRLLDEVMTMARALMYDSISLVAVGGSETFWAANGFRPHPGVTVPASYGPRALYMSRPVEVDQRAAR